ncbi:MAG: YicC/YloC family endoribonuclease [Hyphomicrobiaceae bacterium]
MSLKSMTGFGRADGHFGGVGWTWEVRSVNGRSLDVRLRVPPGSDALEPRVREAVARRFARGSISVSLQLQREAGVTEIRLNEAALEQVLKAAEHIQHLTGCERPRVEGLLALKGVLETVEPVEREAAMKARQDAMVASLEEALSGLAAARAAEGERLTAVLSEQLVEIERLVDEVSASPSRTPSAVAARLAEQVKRLLDTGATLDRDRLHQEAVLIATRADVEEELQRLKAHVAATRELLDETGPAGRKLDFLTQEFNREANTLCSKANANDVTRAGLALKTVIDQMREQVQNIE